MWITAPISPQNFNVLYASVTRNIIPLILQVMALGSSETSVPNLSNYIYIYIYITISQETILFNLQEPCALHIGRVYRYPPDVAFYIFFSTNISSEYFKHAAHSPFFSSKCRLFHTATFFGSCIIHILYTECAKI